MIVVSLEKLVAIKGTGDLLSESLKGFVEKLTADPNDKTTWGVLADWLDEDEPGEYDLAAACRWLAKRPDVTVERGEYRDRSFVLGGKVPSTIRAEIPSVWEDAFDQTAILGFAAALAEALRKVKAQLL